MPGSALVSLGNVGDLSRPATVLVERVSDAIGGLAKPWQIKRVAEAEAGAQRIRTESEIELADLRLRAGHRFIAEQTRIQSNIEGIVSRSVPRLNEDATPEKLEDDWIVNFFDKSRNISDEDMQDLWSRILAGEANNPGSFSRKAINLAGDLDKRDAELFRNICRFAWLSHADSEMHPFVFDFDNEIYARYDISYSSALHLQSLHLITIGFVELGTILRTTGFVLDLPRTAMLSYFGRSVELALPRGQLHIGNVLFTRAGSELAKICKADPVNEFFEYVYTKWINEALVPPMGPGEASAAPPPL